MIFGLSPVRGWPPPGRAISKTPFAGLIAVLRDRGSAGLAAIKSLTPAAMERHRQQAGDGRPARRRATKLFLLITCLIASTDAMFVWINYQADSHTLTETIQEEGRTLVSAFQALVANEEANLARTASDIAKDVSVQRALLAAYRVGYYSDERALAAIRDQLYLYSARFQQNELHYQMGPDLASFLRFHNQGLFGDPIAESRPMVDLVYQSNLSRVGFEVGGTLSGLRAVAPVRAFDEINGEFVRVGTVEAISQMYPIVARFSEQIGGSAVVLLDAAHVEARLMPRAINMRYMQTEFLGEWVFEAASDFALLQEFQDSDFRSAMLSETTHLVQHDGLTLAVTNLPLFDYRGETQTGVPPVGVVVLWRDASHVIAGFNDDQFNNILFAIGAFLMIEALLLIGIRVATFQLTQIVKQQTDDLLRAYQQLKDQSESLSAFAEEVDISRGEAERACQAAEEASRAKSKFLASMSHELRTPLNAIIGFSSIIRDRILGDKEMDKYSEYAGDIYRSGAHLLEIIDDILDIAKIEAGHFALNVELMSLSKLVQDSMRLVRIRAQENNVDVRFAPPADDVRMYADMKALKRILLNLLSNSIKFTPRGGSVTLSVGEMAGDRIYLTVADTGIGIPADKLSVVMEPFEQVDNEYTRTESGTGLGLSLVRSIVDLHGGDLRLESTPNKGTTVTILLPRDPRGGVPTTGPASPGRALAPHGPAAA